MQRGIRPQLARQVESSMGQVHRHDVGGAARLESGNGAETDGADTEDGNLRPGLGSALLDRMQGYRQGLHQGACVGSDGIREWEETAPVGRVAHQEVIGKAPSGPPLPMALPAPIGFTATRMPG